MRQPKIPMEQDVTFTGRDLVAIRRRMGVGQERMAQAFGVSVRGYQHLESYDEIKRVYILAARQLEATMGKPND